mgnify:CR=1 FL=1
MFECTVADQTSYKRLTVRGRIDALSAQEMQSALTALIQEGGRILLADLSGVHYISSAGLRIFIGTQKQLKKAGGEILLAGLLPQVLEVFKVSGFDQLFRIVSGTDDILKPAAPSGAPPSTRQIESGGIRLEVIETDERPGRLFLIGSADKMEKASYVKADVTAVSAAEIRCGCGLAALGDDFEDYGRLFGEAMVIQNNFFYYPAVRHPCVDFLQSAHADASVTYKFLHGFGFNGGDRYTLSFQAENQGAALASLMQSFLTISGADLIGVTLLAESRGIWGMNMKRPPVAEERTAAGESIFSPRLFPEWFDFPVEPSHRGAIVAATGIAARDPQKLPEAHRNLFSGDSPFHLHGGIFAQAPIKSGPRDFESELIRVFNELTVCKIQHLLARSRFAGGLAAIARLEV